MNQLPSEIILKIFNQIPYHSLNYRLVCKRWYSISNLVQFNSLELDREHNVKILNFLENALNDMRFSKLKILFVQFQSPNGLINLDNYVNNFNHLEQLDIRFLFLGERPQRCWYFKLNSIKEFKFTSYLDFEFIMDAPKLIKCEINQNIAWTYEKNVKLIYPESLKSLKMIDISRSNDYDFISKCVNLEKLTTSGHINGENLLEMVRSLSKLKQLDHSSYEARYIKSNSLNQYLQTRPDLIIIYNHIKLKKEYNYIPNPDPYYSSSEEIIDFLLTYHSIIENNEIEQLLSRIDILDYNTFEIGANLIPKSLKMQKFKTIQISSNIVNEIQLLDFIDKSNFDLLKFNQTNLNRSFFNQLESISQKINKIYLNQPSLNIEQNDFDFIFEMRNLIDLTIVNNLDFKFIINIISKNFSLKYFKIIQQDLKYVTILLRERKLFLGDESENYFNIHKFKRKKNLIEFLNKLDYQSKKLNQNLNSSYGIPDEEYPYRDIYWGDYNCIYENYGNIDEDFGYIDEDYGDGDSDSEFNSKRRKLFDKFQY